MRAAVRLNLGSGDCPAPPPWINIDINEECHPDLVADCRALPFASGCAERVYCGHFLEHLPLSEVGPMLREVARVLNPVGGQLCVVGPDCDRALLFDPDTALGALWGARRWPGDEHRWACTEERLLRLVREAVPWAVPVPIAEVPDAWPVTSRIGWQCAVLAPGELGR